MADTARSIEERVASEYWYHVFELPGGVVTPGLFDLRSLLPKLPLPASMKGMRVLDAASADGSSRSSSPDAGHRS